MGVVGIKSQDTVVSDGSGDAQGASAVVAHLHNGIGADSEVSVDDVAGIREGEGAA